jgi:hypothetical protein
LVVASAQGSTEPFGPAKHAAWATATGAVTVTSTFSIGTSQSKPIAFQYSSSWSSKPFIAPSTR